MKREQRRAFRRDAKARKRRNKRVREPQFIVTTAEDLCVRYHATLNQPGGYYYLLMIGEVALEDPVLVEHATIKISEFVPSETDAVITVWVGMHMAEIKISRHAQVVIR